MKNLQLCKTGKYRLPKLILFIRIPVLLFLLCSSAWGVAQTPEDELQKGIRVYNDMKGYVGRHKPATMKDSTINRVKQYLNRAVGLLERVNSTGNTDQQKVARYFIMNSRYQLAFAMGMRRAGAEEYDSLKAIEPDFDFFSDSTQFPMRYAYFGKNFVVRYSNFAPTLSEFYTGLGEIAFNLKKDQEGMAMMQKNYAIPYATVWTRYIAANKMCLVLKKQSPWTRDFLRWNMLALEQISKMDTTNRRIIRDNRYADVPRYAGDIEAVLQQHPDWSDNGLQYARAAVLIEDAKDDQRASVMYTSAIQMGLTDAAMLHRAALFAQRTGNTTISAQANALNKNADGPDNTGTVISGLKPVLDKLISASAAGEKSFSAEKGRRTTSNRYSGNIYETQTYLQGTLECFYNEFRDNSQKNYFYWQSFIAEEPAVNLKGKLLQYNQRLQQALKKSYPNAVFSNPYNDANRLEFRPNGNCTITLAYYNNVNVNRDIILLTVTAEYYK